MMNLLCRKAEFVRTETEGAVQKMFKFFEDMKGENENFFYDFQLDEEKRIKNI